MMHDVRSDSVHQSSVEARHAWRLTEEVRTNWLHGPQSTWDWVELNNVLFPFRLHR